MKKLNLIFIGSIAILITSCTTLDLALSGGKELYKLNNVANKIQYDNLVANIEVQGTKSIAIAALDHREHVLINGKPQDFVGYHRSSYGIPDPIGTKSKQPLADDVASSFKETLSNKGFKCSVLVTTPTDVEKVVIEKLKASGSDISILFLMNSWWTDTNFSTFLLNYDVTISVYDKNGIQLSTKQFTENMNVNAGPMIFLLHSNKY
jgi:hypothetical protein